jgi:hypothetical protein
MTISASEWRCSRRSNTSAASSPFGNSLARVAAFCGWLGHAIYGLAFWHSGGWLALLPQALLLASILWVTGIPPTEAQAIRSKGDAYRAYQRRVSAFVPRPPRAAPERSDPDFPP